MISHIAPSLPRLICDLWTDRMRSPKLDQQVVKVMPLLKNRFRIHIKTPKDVRIGPEDDPLKVLGFNGPERHGDPLDAWPRTLKCQVFEFRCHREVERSHHGPGWVQ